MKNNSCILFPIFFIFYLAFSTFLKAQETKLLPNNWDQDSRAGRSISMSGNYLAMSGRRFVNGVGAPGHVYIYKKEVSGWTLKKELMVEDEIAGNVFGIRVVLQDDYLFIGAMEGVTNGENSGAVYVYKREDEDWIEETRLTASNGAAEDRFGYSLDVSGDYLVIGAYRDDDNGNNSGSAYIFEKSGGVWSEVTHLLPSDGNTNDFFGSVVSISGDYAIIGATKNSNENGANAGAAYVFKRTEESTWIEETKLIASNGSSSERFGGNISMSGNYATIGTSLEFSSIFGAESIYVFKNNGNGWIEETIIDKPSPLFGEGFGRNAVVDGNHILAGAYNESSIHNDAGVAYLFERSGSDWELITEVRASDGEASDWFGYGLAMSEGNLAVGAYFDDDNGTNTGAVYVYDDMYFDCGSSSEIESLFCDAYLSPDLQTYTESGTYIATIPNSIGCDSVITINLTIIKVDDSIIQEGGTFFSNATDVSYQWLDCNNNLSPIPNEIASSFAPTENGSYAVQVTDSICLRVSECLTIATVATTDVVYDFGLSLFPNPIDDLLHLEKNTNQSGIVSVIDIFGKIQKRESFVSTKKEINLSELTTGVYWIVFEIKGSFIPRKIVKK